MTLKKSFKAGIRTSHWNRADSSEPRRTEPLWIFFPPLIYHLGCFPPLYSRVVYIFGGSSLQDSISFPRAYPEVWLLCLLGCLVLLVLALYCRQEDHQNWVQLEWDKQIRAVQRGRLQMLVCVVHYLSLLVQGHHWKVNAFGSISIPPHLLNNFTIL